MNRTQFILTLSSPPSPLPSLPSQTISEEISVFMRVLIALACLLVILLSFLGNTLVVYVILHFKRLKNPTNYILLSLAITDLAVSFLVMFPSMIQDTLQKWIFNNLFCKLYVGFDISCCTASILHLLLTAVDRYIAIFNPLTYKNLVRTWHIVVMVLIVWTLSFSMSFLPIFMGWNELNNVDTNNTEYFYEKNNTFTTTESILIFATDTLYLNDSFNKTPSDVYASTVGESFYCSIEANIPYAIISSSLSFWIPLVIMTIVYIQIYIVARRQQNAIAQLDIRSRGFVHQQSSDANALSQMLKQQTTNGGSKKSQKKENSGNNILNEQEMMKINKILTDETNNDESKNQDELKADKKSKLNKVVKQLKSIERKRTKDTKAIKTLGIIMGIFILCWLPFFIMYVWVGLTQIPFPLIIERLITWIGYINSFINPIIYALTNKDFRKAYKTTLKELFKKCCTRAFYASRFGRNDANNFSNLKYTKKKSNTTHNSIFMKKFNSFFKCCSCCCRKNKSSLYIDNNKKNFVTNYTKKSDSNNQQNLNVDAKQSAEAKNLNARGSIIVFNEKIQEFSYIDNDPISSCFIDKKENQNNPMLKNSVEFLNSIEPLNTNNMNESSSKITIALNDENLKLDEKEDLNENNNEENNSSSPETISSSEKSRVLSRKKSFFKSKKVKIKKEQIEKDFQTIQGNKRNSPDFHSEHSNCQNDLNKLKLKINEINTSIDNNHEQNLENNNGEKRRFSLRKSIFRSNRTKKKANLDDLESATEQLHLTNNSKHLNSLKTISDENDEDSDYTSTPTNTDSTSIKRNSINLASKRSSIPFKRIFSKKETTYDGKRCTSDGSILDNNDFSSLKITSQVFRV